VRRLPEPHELSAQRREEIADGLCRHSAQVDAERQNMSDQEAEDVVNEALRSVKPGFRPIT
jgi:hypothetical protein